MTQTFYWHDYETFGANPSLDRPCQFAGVRTDLELNIIGEPLTIYCRPSDDYLPAPEACLITGITPQIANREGTNESDFIRQIHHELNFPGTCGVGYNSIRFDDEVTRFTLFRNFYDPYEREWKNNNSRWDLIDVVRLAYALRPEGIEWPSRDDGEVSFRLQELTKANGLVHEAAHDALSDVHATIGIARLLKQRHPKLYQFAFLHRDKHSAAKLLDVLNPQPLLHVSSRFPARNGCAAIVLPIAVSRKNKNAVIVLDLRFPAEELLSLSSDDIRQRVFVANDQLAEGVARIPLKQVHLNKCPVLAPLSVLKGTDPERLDRFDLNQEVAARHAKLLLSDKGLAAKVLDAFESSADAASVADVEATLYTGGFLSDADKRLVERCQRSDPWALASLSDQFADQRLSELLFRYRARNFPNTLSSEEAEQWETHRKVKLLGSHPVNSPIKAYFEKIQALGAKPKLSARDQGILEELYYWGQSLMPAD